jgi:hypothetical protein
MEHVLALDLGRTVDELRESMSYLEFRHWMQFYIIRHKREERALRRARGRRR